MVGGFFCGGEEVHLKEDSLTSISAAHDFYPPALALIVRSSKTESDEDFIRRMSLDLRGTEPSPTEIHFFAASKDAARRQKLDLLIQERQAKLRLDRQCRRPKVWRANRCRSKIGVAW